MAVKIAVYNYKGGIGKSTISANLAAGLAKLGYDTSIWNTDGQNNSIKFLTKEPLSNRKTLFDLMSDPNLHIGDIEIKIGDHLSAIPSAKIGNISTHIAMNYRRFDIAMNQILPEEETNKYDYMIFDMGPGESRLNDAILYYVDAIIMPVQTEYSCVDAIGLTYDYLTSISLKGDLIKIVVPNMLDTTNGKTASYNALKSMYDDSVLIEPILKRASIHDSGLRGIPIYDFDQKVSEPFNILVRKVVKEIGTNQR